MKLVNLYWLDHLWAPIAEGRKVASITLVDMNEPENVQRLVDDYLRPYIKRVSPKTAARLKETWRYALNAYGDQQLSNSLDSMLPPFHPPRDIRRFYIAAWELLFANEPWKIDDLAEYVDLRKQFVTPSSDLT